MRKPVVRQIKKPTEKSTTSPIFWPIDIFRRMTTGIGRMKIVRSVARFEIALDQLNMILVLNLWSITEREKKRCAYRCPAKLMHVPGISRSYTRCTGVH
jgi:hypothetical protein